MNKPIPGDYQYRALASGPPAQRFWHSRKLELLRALSRELRRRVYTSSDRARLALARRYGIAYFVLRKSTEFGPPRTRPPVAYENAHFQILRAGSENGGERGGDGAAQPDGHVAPDIGPCTEGEPYRAPGIGMGPNDARGRGPLDRQCNHPERAIGREPPHLRNRLAGKRQGESAVAVRVAGVDGPAAVAPNWMGVAFTTSCSAWLHARPPTRRPWGGTLH